MSDALPGEHYCKEHQGNHSHYAPHNCTVCRLKQILALQATILLGYRRALAHERHRADQWEATATNLLKRAEKSEAELRAEKEGE